MTVAGPWSISGLRDLARVHTSMVDPILDLLNAAEVLRELHEVECGCPAPGALFAGCTWKGPAADLLNSFVFDEEVVRW